MLDDDDSNFAFLAALFTDGPAGLVMLVIAIVIAIVVTKNHDECAKRSCPPGMNAILANHECECVTEAGRAR